MNEKFFEKIIDQIINRKIKNSLELINLKKEISSEFGITLPPNANIRNAYNNLLKRKVIKRNKLLEKVLKSKKVRTISGVAVVAVITKPLPCFGECLYCPQEKNMPKSYLSNEPAVMRAVSVNFNPYQQVQKRLKVLELNGHDVSKIELIVAGGTFSHLPGEYKYDFLKECFRACNDYPKLNNKCVEKNFKKEILLEQKKNETARVRIIGVTLETRPDSINEKEIKLFRELGCTRVEIGVQSIYDSVLKKVKRGHGKAETIKATKLLKDAGFKVGYHLMLGLPGSNKEKDFQVFKKVFSDSSYQPDLVKIYPCVVTEGSDLLELYLNKKYKPLNNEEVEELIIKIKKIIPPYVRISRIIRDIPSDSIIAGPKVSNLRQLISKKVKCQCIRCREVKGEYSKKEKTILSRIDYDASDGKEVFLEICSKDNSKLYSMLRLRIPSKSKNIFSELENAAIIREVHTYGKLTEIKKKKTDSPQHVGFGKRLIQEAEKISREEFNKKKMAVISGVGVRRYYEKIGYSLEGTYMIKHL